MRKLGNIVARLTAARHAMENLPTAGLGGSLTEMSGFGSNPGNLLARSFIPPGLRRAAPLVVVLHGCTQNAASYDGGSGWSQLAKRDGFAVLFPEQQRANNANLCFNWYLPGDARRDHGEARSIAQMVKHMIALHGLDQSQVFVTGLSAGGAMTSVMLASYPELFAGGAVIAGLPFATANSLPEALERMRGQGSPTRKALADRARASAPHTGRKPSLSVWHGTHDTIVDPGNASVIVDQWRDLHGVGGALGAVENVGRHRREVWLDASGREIIERYDIRGMSHGTPLDTRGSDAVGLAGPHMLEAGICSTQRIAAFWGLTDADKVSREFRQDIVGVAPVRDTRPEDTRGRSGDVATIIDDALRAAGLMR